MNLQFLSQTQPIIITGLDLHMTRKQPCESQGCSTRSFSRFGVIFQHYQLNPRYVCCQCASSITGYSFFQLGHAEEYVKRVKPHLKELKDKVHFRQTPNHKNKDVVGQLIQIIGDLHILITEFKSGRYGLMINGKQYYQNEYKYFLSYKKVCDQAVKVINNKYSDKILNFIHYDTTFIMPQ